MRAVWSIAAALCAVVSTSCDARAGRDDRVLTVSEVIENIDALDGQEVNVGGYLGLCMGYDCRLFANEADKAQFDRATEILYREHRLSPEPQYLGIGAGANRDFDRQAAPFNDHWVIIRGTVTNDCRFNGEIGCTDRSTDLIPESVRGWVPGGPTGGAQ